ncbi:MAG TPA: methyltransferase domain-containing protein [Longimicrobiales bacterium]|nr:methyltransferase domain-containing protein [Longimicrobiales bacterium]
MSQRKLTAYDVADHYDEAYFADLAGRYRDRNRFARRRIANVFSLLPPPAGLTLVDLGCGMGTFTIEAAGQGAFAVGVDPAPAAVQAATRVAAAEGTASAHFIRADAAVLPLATASADIVLAADLTEHLDDVTLARILREAGRVLRTDGRLVLYTPDRQHIFERLRDRGIMRQDPSHIGVRSAAELAQAVEGAGFAVQRLEWLPSHLPGLSLAEAALARWVPVLRRRIGLVAVPAPEAARGAQVARRSTPR